MTSTPLRAAVSAFALTGAAALLGLAASGAQAVVVERMVVPSHPGVPERHAAFELEQAEIRHCLRGVGRTWSDCADEAEAKALIRRAEWVAQLDARRGAVRGADDDLLEPAPPAPAPAGPGMR